MRVAICDDNQQDIERIRRYTVFCKYKLPKNAEALPKSCSGKFLKVA